MFSKHSYTSSGRECIQKLRRKSGPLAEALASSMKSGACTARSSTRGLEQVRQTLQHSKNSECPPCHVTTNDSYIDREKVYVDSFRKLLAFSSTVKAELAKEGGDPMSVASLLDAARSDTRRVHSSTVKRVIGDWHTFSPGPSKKHSSPWGWDHDECMRMLCPMALEWNDA